MCWAVLASCVTKTQSILPETLPFVTLFWDSMRFLHPKECEIQIAGHQQQVLLLKNGMGVLGNV